MSIPSIGLVIRVCIKYMSEPRQDGAPKLEVEVEAGAALLQECCCRYEESRPRHCSLVWQWCVVWAFGGELLLQLDAGDLFGDYLERCGR